MDRGRRSAPQCRRRLPFRGVGLDQATATRGASHRAASCAKGIYTIGAGDTQALFELCSPDLQSGPPDDPVPGCHSRDEALRWYREARDSGRRAEVTEVCAGREAILVGLRVFDLADGGSSAGPSSPAGVQRWQVMVVRDGLVTDIGGFEDRATAAARAGIGS